MLKLIANLVERRPKTIVIVVLVLTIIVSASLVKVEIVEEEDEDGNKRTIIETEPRISFKTDIDKFLPDNPLVRANNRVDEYFGEDFLPHVIYAKAENTDNNVLTPKAIREMYNITAAIRDLEGVDGSVSVADAINEISKYRLNLSTNKIEKFEDYNLGRMDSLGIDFLVKDSEIQRLLNLIFDVLDGTLNVSEWSEQFGDLPLGEESVADVEFALGLILSEDFSIDSRKAEATIIVIQMNGTLSSVEAKELAGQIREKVEDMDLYFVSTQQTSQYLISYDIDLNSTYTFTFLAVGIFGLIIIVLALSFRRLSYIFLPIITLVIATIWTIGTMYYLNLSITAMMVAVIPLIIGLGVDYSVHVLRRYQEELRKGGTVALAIKNSIINVGGAIALAMITTVIAFLSNFTSAVIPVRDFGISCAAGVFYAFILTMTFHCSLRLILDKRAMRKHLQRPKGKHPLLIGSWHTEKDKKLGLYDSFSNIISKAVIKEPAVIAVLTVIFTIGAVVAAMNVKSEFTLQEFLPSDWESVEASYLIMDEFEVGSYAVSYILVEGDDVGTVDALTATRAAIENAMDDKHVVRIETSQGSRTMIESIFDITKIMVERNSTLQDIYNFDDEGFPNQTCMDEDVTAFFDYLYFNETVSDPLTGQTFGERARKMIHREPADRNLQGTYTATVIRVYISTLTSTDNREMHQDLKNDVKGLDFGGNSKVTITGLMVLTIETVDTLQENMIRSTIIAVALAAIILIILYRNFLLGLMPPIPVVLCSLWIVGTMFLLSFSLNILTVMVTALTIGLGIDYSIHVMERFREEKEKRGKGVHESIHTTIMSTGTALTISAVTTILGFGVLIFSPMPVAQQFGVITAITIIFSFLAAVLVLPVILIAWAKRREKKEFSGLPQFSSLEKIEVKRGPPKG